MSIASDISALKTLSDGVVANKVSRFAYTEQAYTDNEVNGVTAYDVNAEQNIPVGTPSVMKVNQTVVEKGWRARASSITRMLMNHFLGRISYNLNKINDWFNSFLASMASYLGTPNGIATLDQDGRIPYSQLPESAIELKGYWDASTNTPALVDGTGTNGDEYIVSVAGTRDLGSGSQYFGVGDRVLYTSGVWKNISSGFIRTINNLPPNAQGERRVVLGENNLLITKGFLGAVFGRLLARKWTQGTGATSYTMQYLVYANGLWVCGSDSHGMWWSEDGKSWTQGTGATSYAMQYLVYANGLWVCGSDSHGLWWSADGKSWTQGTGANTAYSMRYLVYANGLWVCGSIDYGLWWSADGKSWTQGTGANTSYTMLYLVYANGLWVCGSNNHGLWWSADGKSWTQGTGDNATYTMLYLVYANGLWVCGSNNHGVWWSEDGKSWTQGTGSNTTYVMSESIYANGLWVCGSNSHGMWWSEDGKSWTQGTGATSYAMQYLVYANGLWVCGSYGHGMWWGNDVETLIVEGAINLGADIPLVNS